jgi:hypothetical protein
VVDLRLHDIEPIGDEGYRGTVENTTAFSVRNIEVRIACVAEDGAITRSWPKVIDLRKLDPGESVDFETTPRDGACADGTAYVAAAKAAKRDV